uniref:Polyprotein n=1 Tax=Onchocerca flexuosa TaxID=387005 RepID=A0A183HYZ1_9BILA
LNRWSLLTNNVERLCVVASQINCSTHQKRINYRTVRNYLLSSRSRCGTISSAIYLCDGSQFKIADHCNGLRIFSLMWNDHTHFLNYFNMVILFLYRQNDLQHAVIYGFKSLFCKKKYHVQRTTTTRLGE